ncbi:MAG TPA: hypothetical protein VMX74_10725, partial [Pirellulales bacterium]|nr:hypothetical protein [Pirellulales bacterium]
PTQVEPIPQGTQKEAHLAPLYDSANTSHLQPQFGPTTSPGPQRSAYGAQQGSQQGTQQSADYYSQ